MSTHDAGVWPILSFRDAPAMLVFLRDAFGLVPTVVIEHPEDQTVIQHAEARWPLGLPLFNDGG